ncbi:MAG: hypothetical protein PUK72_03535 [Oscillospiraceae bacterium]|nr:hypothetical protein [Oscillospiraceae bacterium]MDD7470159.1 hypothetical protein [Oscillospiraceae bacterium]MDY2678157.1 hypothetical protein [Oscillospiraceae bacterium]
MTLTCKECGKKLTDIDIGFHKKMINRGAVEYMCLECVCRHFDITKERAYEMIERFKKSGCKLFN